MEIHREQGLSILLSFFDLFWTVNELTTKRNLIVGGNKVKQHKRILTSKFLSEIM